MGLLAGKTFAADVLEPQGRIKRRVTTAFGQSIDQALEVLYAIITFGKQRFGAVSHPIQHARREQALTHAAGDVEQTEQLLAGDKTLGGVLLRFQGRPVNHAEFHGGATHDFPRQLAGLH
ncbi:hypothetical protein D3C86_1831540 [compost metagenome]